jgi:hypothetical protein
MIQLSSKEWRKKTFITMPACAWPKNPILIFLGNDRKKERKENDLECIFVRPISVSASIAFEPVTRKANKNHRKNTTLLSCSYTVMPHMRYHELHLPGFNLGCISSPAGEN